MNASLFSRLELKVIPVVQAFIALAAMYISKSQLPEWVVVIPLNNYIALCLFIIGGFIGGLSVYCFKKANTTVNPTKPECASRVVDYGIFSWSRNPMYLAIALGLLSAGVYLQHIATLFVLPCFVLYITRFQIIPEERALLSLFKEDYANYQTRVRRWL